MGNEITIDDLVSDSSGGSGGSGGPDGDWLTSMVDKLDEKGLLEPLIFGPDAAADSPQTAPEIGNDSQHMESETPDSMDADAIKNILLQVYDNAEFIPGLSDDPTLSELIKFVDSKPKLVDKMIEKHL